ncbi:MAG: hypothetical protein AAFN30_13635 [Actinomycetota bacterium]
MATRHQTHPYDLAPPATRPARYRPTQTTGHPMPINTHLDRTGQLLTHTGHPPATTTARTTPAITPCRLADRPALATLDHPRQPPTGEPHPWGEPLPIGHPGHRPPRRLGVGVFARWFVYATALTLAAIVVLLVAVAALQRQTPSTGPTGAVHADTFTPVEGDTSRYHGPTNDLGPAATVEPTRPEAKQDQAEIEVGR